MKEFYFREVGDEIYFFFRNKNNISREKWIEKCNKIKLKENKTFENLLLFLEINETSNYRTEFLNITVWKGLEYKLIKFEIIEEKRKKNGNKLEFEEYVEEINKGEKVFILKTVNENQV